MVHQLKVIAGAKDVVVDFKAGDRRTRDQLVRQCMSRVRKTIMMAYGNGPDMDDLAQIAMTKIVTRIDTFKGNSDFGVWVDRVAINTVRDYYRSRWIWYSRADDKIEQKVPAGNLANPESDVARTQLRHHISQSFTKLKPAIRMATVLSVVNEYSSAEIAVMLDISLPAARKRVERGRRLLMEHIRHNPVCRDALKEIGQ